MGSPLTCIYQAKDGRILINTDEDAWFASTCKILNCQPLLKDARFIKSSDRNAPSYDEDGKVVQKAGKNFPMLHAELQKAVTNEERGPLVKRLLEANVPADKI